MQIETVPTGGPPEQGPPGDTRDENGRAKIAGRRVLLLEDEAMIAFQLKVAMEDEGASVTFARSLKKGLEAVERQTFDAAVLDVDLGGGETCEAVAKALREGGTPFILHTGTGKDLDDVVERIDAPIVTKPIHPDRLIDRLATLIAVQGGA